MSVFRKLHDLGSAHAAKGAAPVSAEHPLWHPETGPLLLSFATQTGVSEEVADDTRKQLEAAGVQLLFKDLIDLDLDTLQSTRQALFLISTTYDGDPPDMAEEFCNQFMGAPAQLAQLEYGLAAFGDSIYDTFCGFGHRFDAWLQAGGATRWFDILEVDDEDEKALARWHAQVAALTPKAEHETVS